MKRKNLGVSAVIGVILMIAITVAIAATVFTWLNNVFEDSMSFTDDENIISFAKTIDVGINETENTTISYTHFATKHDNNWYSITIYLNYVNEPWRNSWYGVLWFKMDGSNYLKQ